MRIFKTGSYTWWQVGLLKFALLCFGVVIGAHWSFVFLPYTSILLGFGVVAGVYLSVVWLKQ